ncbi:SDR family NAD(P)-dependent oxidoreductase [Pseudoteredinibacter isoporae]|uniref:Short-subunit dehydrogenase n=1 Tax=Pseudoteredinibacter isoporae TaxID=570281 RepID=A0A7X0JRJ3_9GAMM|nr:SDR family NAD(P)-dependent oxidoreductase [Pseudoteredinibacter isoporae]MBB6520086.1 short-subunit dehydrogenase [Pseudoteredinibacter isoporae]NHO85658.1 SDR family NAD(P)-dependent oxidoreductase [Pseudoteredinibacter isoporae]NIB25890.1 SDR family NAD(P)-dependent oxidoreductase [Pseudoteredinibacter isoporae]
MESVWLTGASQGIGRALALELAKERRRIYVSARNELALQELKQEAEREGYPGLLIPKALDICQSDEVQRVCEEIRADGKIDSVILNAGTYQPAPASEFNCQSLRELFELNVFGTANCLEVGIKTLLKQEGGQIAVVASLAAYRGLPNSAGYGASKSALIHLVESLYTELHEHNIDIKVINPGFVETPLTDKNEFPMPQIVTAEWAARRIVKGLNNSGFEIRFPFVFAQFMGFLRSLPYGLYFRLLRRFVKH